MEKIKVTLTVDKLRELNKAWDLLDNKHNHSPELKVMQDICSRLATRFKKLFIEKELKRGEFSLKLYYSEAYFLYRTLSQYLYQLDVVDTPYEYNLIFKLINTIHQKLV